MKWAGGDFPHHFLILKLPCFLQLLGNEFQTMNHCMENSFAHVLFLVLVVLNLIRN